MPASALPDIDIHYVGHAAFILKFENGMTILMDYGQSRAYGLDSPIYELGRFQPDIVTYSHHHEDHDRGRVFEEARVISGENLTVNGITLTAIAVTENSLGDTYGYLIEYKGRKIFHSGDSQGDMVRIGEDEVRQRLAHHLPDRLDLLLAPIGWTRDIVPDAEAYIDFLHPRRVIPMHYWAESEKARFLAYLKTRRETYRISEIGGSRYVLSASGSDPFINVISLTAGPYTEQAVRDTTPSPPVPCRICSQLADRETASQKFGWEEYDTTLPEAAAHLRLVKDFKPLSSRKLQLKQCPECGTYYLYETDYEYLVNGSEDEEWLTRLTEDEAQAYLQKPAPG